MPWSRPRALPPDGLVVKYVEPTNVDISERYAVAWADRVHIGTLNGIGNEATTPRASLSTVMRAKARIGGQPARVVKSICKTSIPYPMLFQHQVQAMLCIDSPHVCKVYDVYEDKHRVYLALESLAGPSLLEKALCDPHFCERDAAAAFKVLLQALATLHSKRVAHQNVHAENLRYAYAACAKRSSQAQAQRSCYHDGLRLLDFGLSMKAADLLSMPQADGEQIPLLPVVGARASAGFACVPPELSGLAGTGGYARLLESVGLGPRAGRRRASSAARTPPKCASSARSQASGVRSLRSSTCATDSARSRSPDPRRGAAFGLLEVADMWGAGSVLHLLLSGTLPPTGEDHAVARLPDTVSPVARTLCEALLRRDPALRPRAEEALSSLWFSKCEAVLTAHPSQPKGPTTAYTAPLSTAVRGRLAKHHALLRLRKLVQVASAVRSTPLLPDEALGVEPRDQITEDHLPKDPAKQFGPPVVPARVTPEAEARELVFLLSREAFRAMLVGRTSSPTKMAVNDLAELVDAAERGGGMPWKNPHSLAKRLTMVVQGNAISAEHLAEFVWEACR